MDIFAVFKQGVYRHECAGTFSTFEVAIEAARAAIAGEPDDYHTYTIVPFQLDTPTPQTPNKNGNWLAGDGGILEAGHIVVLSRKRGVITEDWETTDASNPNWRRLNSTI